MSANATTPILKVSSLNGFTAGIRVSGQDVEASPPQLHGGTISSVWSDGSAIVKWDPGFSLVAEGHLVQNGRVNLHHLRRMS